MTVSELLRRSPATRLEAAAGPVRIAGQPATALAYNGGLPRRILRLQPRDRLQVELVNRLTNSPNLRVHGLHVCPQGNGDNPFVTVDPGASFSYDHQMAALIRGLYLPCPEA